MKINEVNEECAVELSKEDLKNLYNFFSNHLLVPRDLDIDPWNGSPIFTQLCRAMDLILETKEK